MKRFFSRSIGTGIVLSMMMAPLAMAQQDQHGPAGAAPGHGDVNHGDMKPGDMKPGNMKPGNPPSHAAMQAPHPAPVQHPPMQVSHDQRPQVRPNPSRPAPHVVSNGHRWRQGDRYSDQRRVVGNWSHYHLRQPPSGYEWVQDGDQFVLIAITSGIIADVIANALSQ